MKYIDKDELIKMIYKSPVWTGLDAIARINAMPSIDLDTDEWCEDCKEYDKEHHNCPRFNHVIRTALEDADMVRVVRCKECRHWCNHKDADYDQSEFTYYCEVHGISLTGNDFCSYGERKSDE